jgi:predicted dienelactone hydrolase
MEVTSMKVMTSLVSRNRSMRAAKVLVASTLFFTATLAQAAGFRSIDIPADAEGPAIEGAIWSPCAEPPGEVHVRNRALPGVADCPLLGDNLPLVVVSHGRGGSFIGHHDTAEVLADAGFVVAAINHPGDNSADLSRVNDLSTYVERPTDIKRLIDVMVGTSPFAARIDSDRIGFFGFSRGGYTGLVLIGGNPDWASAPAACRHSSSFACGQLLRQEFPPTPLTHDARIKAAVLADPLAPLFNADSLEAVNVPVQLWASERGGDGVAPHDVAAVDKNLPATHEYHVVTNAGHFAFVPPCPPAAAPQFCTDAPGFDRAAFHAQFNADVLAFLQTHLPAKQAVGGIATNRAGQ